MLHITTTSHSLACALQLLCSHAMMGLLYTCSRSLLLSAAPCQVVCTIRRRGVLPVRQRNAAVCSAAVPKLNPQNTPNPKVLPSKDFGPEETVRAQLEALKHNDDPWPNHGLQTAYEFGEDIGGMERSRYFGYSKDLYHFDHFLGQFQNEFPELVGLTDYSIDSVQEGPNRSITVEVLVSKGSQEVTLRFLLLRKDVGRKKGALMTKSLTRL